MAQLVDIRVPDIGDFKDVPVIDVLVKPGDRIEKEASLITLESDKATMDVPSPRAGVVKEVKVKVGDKVSEGSLILTLEAEAAEAKAPAKAEAARAEVPPANAPERPAAPPPAPAPAPPPAAVAKGDLHAEVLVLGAGPGGYTAAFRAADLGKKVVLVERYPALGGVCLNVGCIPSKALLHVAKVLTEVQELGHAGITFGQPQIELAGLRKWKEDVVGRLTKGLAALAKQRQVQVVQGVAEFSGPHALKVKTAEGEKTLTFDYAVIAAGSQAAKLPGLPYEDPRVMDSTDALRLDEIPKRLLVIGGGIIGLEMATVYHALGSKVSVVELLDGLIPGADRDVVKPLEKRIRARYEAIYLKTKVARLEALKEGLKATFEGEQAPAPQVYDRVLVAVGRRPNGHAIQAQAAGVRVDERGTIPVDRQQRTNVAHIFAIGDIVGEPMLAHKATHEGKVAAEVIAGLKSAFDARAIPSVAYTDPEVAWMGATELDLKAQGIAYERAVFPWAASGRALAEGGADGLTKLLFDQQSRRLLGAAMVGPNAGELIAETVLALEMGADAEDIGLTIHPHPTLSETVCFAAEMAEGTITDLYVPKKK
ncbi:MAG: dihydrolipoyl dehydrogenase [Burkholderiales bacterium]|nr:MAG: dihydrolipoyl dehydrogenase [Burkholderiales bacterium]